jgi:tRNA 2-thiouridine synthesizing protein E
MNATLSRRIVDTVSRIWRQREMSKSQKQAHVAVDEEGFLLERDQWDEGFAKAVAAQDGLQLTDTHWGLIHYFRDYWDANETHPDMNTLVLQLGKQEGDRYDERKDYREFIYGLFPGPLSPTAELAKLAGLPKPLEDVY